MSLDATTRNPGYYHPEDCDPKTFQALISKTLSAGEVPLAADIQKNIPLYDATAAEAADPTTLMSEWAWVLGQGPGALVIRQAQSDHDAIDAASEIFRQIIAQENGRADGGADHFAAAGANDRIWNSLQKLCLADPAVFARYHASPTIDLVCRAWLGAGYQMTAQVNLVRPGGKAQTGHRDYHLGFMTEAQAASMPAHAHHLSPVLTLQGGLAHVDMDIEAGPTKLLPYSQQYGPGYLAYRQDAFAEIFERAYVQLPLAKGDAIFFNPALFHAGGENRTTSVERLVNLFQVSSPMGRAMESIDRDAMIRALYPILADMPEGAGRNAAIAASAEGYAFPTSLDTDPPVGGLAPATQADLTHAALLAGDDAGTFGTALDALNIRRLP